MLYGYRCSKVSNVIVLQPDQLTHALEISNYVFAALFAAEMLLKLMSYGVFGYIKNGFNLFDGVIVILR